VGCVGAWGGVEILVQPSKSFPLPVPRLVWLPLSNFKVVDAGVNNFEIHFNPLAQQVHILVDIFQNIEEVGFYAFSSGARNEIFDNFFNMGVPD
jgi:hypothetical protein